MPRLFGALTRPKWVPSDNDVSSGFASLREPLKTAYYPAKYGKNYCTNDGQDDKCRDGRYGYLYHKYDHWPKWHLDIDNIDLVCVAIIHSFLHKLWVDWTSLWYTYAQNKTVLPHTWQAHVPFRSAVSRNLSISRLFWISMFLIVSATKRYSSVRSSPILREYLTFGGSNSFWAESNILFMLAWLPVTSTGFKFFFLGALPLLGLTNPMPLAIFALIR